MSKTSASVKLFRALVAGCDLGSMRLSELDRLSSSVETVIQARIVGFDLFELRQFAEEVDRVRALRRLVRSGHVPGQLDCDDRLVWN